jgi:hypothetical protein
LTGLIGVGAGWLVDHRRQRVQIEKIPLMKDYGELHQRIDALECVLREKAGIRLEYINGENNWIEVSKNPDGTETRRFNGFLNDGERKSPPTGSN